MGEISQTRCWLCGCFEPLTSEHVPPRSAFNNQPVALQQISQAALDAGYVAWERGAEYRNGHALNSLCTRCNHLGGRTFVPSYSDFVHQIAERVSTRIPLQSISIASVRNPQLILRQVLLQFVSVNGASFVNANPWIKSMLLSRKACRLPKDVYVYLFATQSRGLRTTGVSGHVRIDKGDYRVVSEFTHWPLGTVMSFTKLIDEPLFSITGWSEIQFNSKATVDVELPVNPIESALPIDFRDALGILLDIGKAATTTPDEKLVCEMLDEVKLRSGHTNEDAILTASPAQVELYRQGRSLRESDESLNGRIK